MLTRRSLLKTSGFAIGAGILPMQPAALAAPVSTPTSPIYLNLNESAFGPSPRAVQAAHAQFARINRYADATQAAALTEQIAAKERVAAEQIVLGEVLDVLGTYYAAKGGAGDEFLYSSPGYLALIDSAARLGGVGVPVPLDREHRNDLAALAQHVNARTRAMYLVNPHNPSGTVNDAVTFHSFLREVSQRVPIIVDEAYLEYLPDFASRSAVALVRESANVIVFRTFDKIHGLAGLPMGYAIVPRGLGDTLREQGAGNLEALGRLNLAAASAALEDVEHVRQVGSAVAVERANWNAFLDDQHITRTNARASFVFFNAGRPQAGIAAAMHEQGVVIGRLFPPYTDWVRITIGLPEQNKTAQARLREVLAAKTPPQS